MTLLMLLSVLGAAALFIALAIFLVFITNELEAIGGPATRFKKPVNYLSKIRLGVRAIEVQTGGLVPQVTKLNAGLGAVKGGLEAIDSNLAGVIAAVSRQKP
jgi:heme A synthase